MEDSDEFLLAELLVQESLCASNEEAAAIAGSLKEDIIAECDSSGNNNNVTILCELLQDYLGVSKRAAASILEKLGQSRQNLETANDINDETSVSTDVVEGDGEDDVFNEAEDEEDDDDDDSIIGPGECCFCERSMKLTRHHLIPKSTWHRLETKLLKIATAAASALSNAQVTHATTDIDQDDDTADDGRMISHLVPQIIRDAAADGTKNSCNKVTIGTVRNVFRHQTVDVCRPCHSHIHRVHDNMTLATRFNTADRLLADPAVHKFAKWASSQRQKQCRRDAVVVMNGRNNKRMRKPK